MVGNSLVPFVTFTMTGSRSSSILAFNQILGLILLLLLSIVVAVEMAFGMVIADFCYDGTNEYRRY